MQKKNRIAIGLIAAIIMLACACPVSGLPGTGAEPTEDIPFIPATEEATEVATEAAPTQEEPQVLPANVVFSDDFSAPSAEMEEYTSDEGGAGTENGVYVVRSSADLWQWGKSESEFENVVVEVDVTMAAGPSNNNAGFGVVCRLAEAEDSSIDGYMLAISGDGYYTIRSITASSMTAMVDWEYSSVINQGNTTNRLRVTCNGSDLSLEVNGELVASASATAGGSASGSIGFAAISFESDQPYAEAHFDNLVVSQP